MTTTTELQAAYAELAESAPSRYFLDLPHQRPERRVSRLRIGLAAVTVVALAATPFVVVGVRSHRASEQPVGVPNTSVTFDTSYRYGPDSLPGFTLYEQSLGTDWVTLNYSQASFAAAIGPESVDIQIRPASSDFVALVARAAPLTVAGHPAVYGYLDPFAVTSNKKPGSVAWQLNPRQWVVVSGTAARRPGTGAPLPSLGKAELLQRANTLTARTDDHAAPVSIGYLPRNLVFANAGAFGDGSQVITSDGTSCTSYASLDFRDRRTTDSANLTIDTTMSARFPLSASTLPYQSNWRAITVKGHPGFVSDHDVIVQWGNVQVHVSNLGAGVPGTPAQPVIARSELLKIAESLTVGPSVGFGRGFPLVSAVPDGHLQ